MTASASNKKNPNGEVTPDLVVQPSPDYGIVAEAKLRFPREVGQWTPCFEQLQKYDDDLEGWFTDDGRMPTADVMLLTHDEHAIRVTDKIRELVSSGEIAFDHKFSVVGCIRYERNGCEVIKLQKSYGDVSDLDLNKRLHDGRSIRLETLIELYKMQLCDQVPPIAYLMDVIWTGFLPGLILPEDYMETRGETYRTIRTTAADLTAEMRRSLNPDSGTERVPGIPLTTWVKGALDMLCRLKYATRTDEVYEIHYRDIKEPLAKFIERLASLDLKQEEKERQRLGNQGTLPLYTDDM